MILQIIFVINKREINFLFMHNNRKYNLLFIIIIIILWNNNNKPFTIVILISLINYTKLIDNWKIKIKKK